MICPKTRVRSQYKDCGGTSICQHDRQRSDCKDWGHLQLPAKPSREQVQGLRGSEHLPHKPQESTECKDCGGVSICALGPKRSHYKDCKQELEAQVPAVDTYAPGTGERAHSPCRPSCCPCTRPRTHPLTCRPPPSTCTCHIQPARYSQFCPTCRRWGTVPAARSNMERLSGLRRGRHVRAQPSAQEVQREQGARSKIH
jgi:hypothetical protein